VQVIPAILPDVDQLTSFIRGPTWISGPFAMEPRNYTEEDIAAFAEKPETLHSLRCELEKGMNTQYGIFFAGSEYQNMFRQYAESGMRSKLNDEALEQKLIPPWDIGCRRVTPGMKYLECLKDPKISLVMDRITKITETGCVASDGKEHSFDG
jgi:cation diffusion facilitator CzcD-associated flavoprotein CzcO